MLQVKNLFIKINSHLLDIAYLAVVYLPLGI